MKRKLIYAATGSGALILMLAAGLSLTVAMRQSLTFEAPFPATKASSNPELIRRGQYLVYGPAHCASCHTPAEMEARVERGEPVPLLGGRQFELPIGTLYSSNITTDAETGIGSRTDAELARTLRYGVSHTGRAFLDLMPFQNLSEEDMTAIISYLRTQQPVKNKVPENEFNALGYLVNAFLIKPVGPSGEIPERVVPAETAEYGKYLAYSVANCRGCHTSRDLKTGAYTGPDFAGGLRLEVPGRPGTFLLTPNITPHPETGRITGWSEEQFIGRFRQGKLIHGSEMPWGPFSRMDDSELKALYRYLQTVAPVENPVPLGIQKDKA